MTTSNLLTGTPQALMKSKNLKWLRISSAIRNSKYNDGGKLYGSRISGRCLKQWIMPL